MTITPPIKDTNKNGTLDGAEIVAQLAAEEQKESERTSSEPVHGVFEMLGMRFANKQVFKKVIEKAVKDPTKQQADIYKGTGKALENQILRMLLKPDEQLISPKAMSEAEENLKTLEESPEKIVLSDALNFVKFVTTFKSTFPKGVKISDEEAKGILGHFGGVILPPPPLPATPQAPEKPKGKTI